MANGKIMPCLHISFLMSIYMTAFSHLVTKILCLKVVFFRQVNKKPTLHYSNVQYGGPCFGSWSIRDCRAINKKQFCRGVEVGIETHSFIATWLGIYDNT